MLSHIAALLRNNPHLAADEEIESVTVDGEYFMQRIIVTIKGSTQRWIIGVDYDYGEDA